MTVGEVPRKPTRPARARPSRAKGKPAAPPPPPPVVEDDGGRVEVRRETARLLAVCGMSSTMAVEELISTFGLGERTAWRYVQIVREAWTKVEIEERPGQRAWLFQVQIGVLVDARKDGDHKAANGAIRNLIDLLGLKVSKVELQEGGLDALVAALKATPAQRDDRIDELEAKAAAEGVDLQGLGDGAHPG